MKKNERLQRLAHQIIETQRTMSGLCVQYLFARGGIHTIFDKKRGRVLMTPRRLLILKLLSLTMVSAHILVAGGVVRHIRTAQRELRSLFKKRYLGFYKYAMTSRGSFRYFYYLKKEAWGVVGKETREFHKINEGTVAHDSITAIFMTHLFRCSAEKGIAVKWYPPFTLDDKICDGGVSLSHDGKLKYSIILEADRGTHDHREIAEKIETYSRYLNGHRRRIILFLVTGDKRAENIRKTADKVLRDIDAEKYQRQILVLNPLTISHEANIFQTKREENDG